MDLVACLMQQARQEDGYYINHYKQLRIKIGKGVNGLLWDYVTENLNLI